MAKISFARGVASKVVHGKKVNVDSIEVPEYGTCCRLDCTTKGLYIEDIATGTLYVGWFQNGTWTTGTEAQFLAAKAALCVSPTPTPSPSPSITPSPTPTITPTPSA